MEEILHQLIGGESMWIIVNPIVYRVSMGFNGFQPSVWWCISSIHLSGTCPGPTSPGHRGDGATGRHGRHGPPGEEGEAKAAEAEALETAGQTRQRLGKKYVKSMGIYGDIHVCR